MEEEEMSKLIVNIILAALIGLALFLLGQWCYNYYSGVWML